MGQVSALVLQLKEEISGQGGRHQESHLFPPPAQHPAGSQARPGEHGLQPRPAGAHATLCLVQSRILSQGRSLSSVWLASRVWTDRTQAGGTSSSHDLGWFIRGPRGPRPFPPCPGQRASPRETPLGPAGARKLARPSVRAEHGRLRPAGEDQSAAGPSAGSRRAWRRLSALLLRSAPATRRGDPLSQAFVCLFSRTEAEPRAFAPK